MSQHTHPGLEEGNDPEIDQNRSTPNQPSQPFQPQKSQPPQVETNIGDSSEPIFSTYTNAVEHEDNKMVESWQKDAKGILIFTGLFSATVAALLTVTIPDLKPSSQDTSAFYLGNIYEVLADPNITRASIPSSAAKPPPFSAPRYAVWVNSLWFLSLVMSFSCALWATSLNQWARRYIRLTQPARCSPDKRARLRAYYAHGVEKMHTPWAVEGLPLLLHLSLFLFFGGLAVYLFHVDHEVFACVVSWIGFFSMVYGLITLLPLFRPESPYNTPLSIPLLFLIVFLFITIICAAAVVFLFAIIILSLAIVLIPLSCLGFCMCCRPTIAPMIWNKLQDRLGATRRMFQWVDGPWKSGGVLDWDLLRVEKDAEKEIEKQSSEIDGWILGWTIRALGDDDSLKKFFEDMPGFFDSEKVKDIREHIPYDLLRNALAGFLGRTLSSKSVDNKVKLHRLDILVKTTSLVGEDTIGVSSILKTFFFKRWDLAPQTIEVANTLARWHTSSDQCTAWYARCTVARVLATVRERADDRWVELAAHISGIPKHDLRDIAQTDIAQIENNLSLAILIDLCRQTIHFHEWDLLMALSKFDIRDTLPKVRHDFCTLWNEIVDKARNSGDLHYDNFPRILFTIRRLYFALHEGIDAAPNEHSAAHEVDFILSPSSWTYPLCRIAHHLHRPYSIDHTHVVDSRAFPPLSRSPHALPHRSTCSGITVSRQVKQEGITTRPRSLSEPTKPRKIAEGSQETPASNSPAPPAHTCPYPTHASLPDAVAALQDIPPAAMLSRPLDGTPPEESNVDEIMPTASSPAPAPTLVPVAVSIRPVLSDSFAFSDAGAAPTFDQSLSALSVVDVSGPASPLSRNLLFPTLLSNTTLSRTTGSFTVQRLRTRGLVNTGSMCFANAVLQLFVHSPPFWNLFMELGDLKGQRRASPNTGGSASPLVDATVRFFEEFVFKEGPPPTQQQPQTAGRNQREDNEAEKDVDSFEPTYMYDVMMKKRQLKRLLVGHQQDAEEFFHLFLDALDEEIPTLFASISGHKSAAVEERELSQIGQSEVGNRGFPAESVESPLTRIFGGKFHSIVRGSNRVDTVTIEDWRSLHLDIQHDSVHTIEDALTSISHLQPVQLGSSGSSAASQQVLVEGLPPVLVLHLKRFLYNAEADGIVKISKPVQFAPELEIPLEIMAPVAEKSVELPRYKLYGVLYHHGQLAGSGHYTVDVLLQSEGGGRVESWMHVDDEAVSAVQHEDVFGGRDNEHEDERCAYMLFYYRIAPAQI